MNLANQINVLLLPVIKQSGMKAKGITPEGILALLEEMIDSEQGSLFQQSLASAMQKLKADEWERILDNNPPYFIHFNPTEYDESQESSEKG